MIGNALPDSVDTTWQVNKASTTYREEGGGPYQIAY